VLVDVHRRDGGGAQLREGRVRVTIVTECGTTTPSVYSTLHARACACGCVRAMGMARSGHWPHSAFSG